LNKKGTLSTTGTVGIDPVTADLKMDLKGIEIGPFQSYFTDKVKITITDGVFSTTGDLSLGISDNKEFKTTYRGEASLSNFSSIDKQNAEDFLKWESLSFSDLNVGHNPLLVDVKGISLTNFYTRLIIHPDGALNVQEIMVKEEPKKETAPPATQEKAAPPTQEKASPLQKEKEPAKNIKIGTVTLQGGRVDFSDRSLKPDYSTKLVEIGGRISGLSSEETTLADVELRGKLDDFAPLEITGKINPLKEDLYVDLKARFKDVELSSMAPYSGKYVGYTIEKGKLSFDLTYLINKRKLDSQNHIFLDQFTLGEKVESPQATKLPVKLAIALLKDRKGEIKLDIPVAGTLDDPKFSVWGIILKILVNLIAKAATSPFSLLGAIIGGGEELSFVEFEYGSPIVTEPSAKKLNAIAKALNDRPSLKMDIEGHVDMEKDREGLKQVLFNRKLNAQKLNEMVKKGQPAVPLDEVKIEKPEYDKYLKMAYKEEKFPKPKNVLGMAKDIPVSEMEKLILTHLEIKDGDLRTLASQRAMKVKEAIVKSGQVEPERIFILEPKSLAPEKKEKLKDSRVDFKLK
jgi:flagellar motor protein MotB